MYLSVKNLTDLERYKILSEQIEKFKRQDDVHDMLLKSIWYILIVLRILFFYHPTWRHSSKAVLLMPTIKL